MSHHPQKRAHSPSSDADSEPSSFATPPRPLKRQHQQGTDVLPSHSSFVAPLLYRARTSLRPQAFRRLPWIHHSPFFSSAPREPPKLSSLDLAGVARYIIENDCRNIIVMTGAGASVSAGIPDFRTPGTGLYDNLQKYNLPTPEAVFDLDFFRHTPNSFYTLAKELFPGNFKPTLAHAFIRLLHDKGMLLRNFTQNIDGLERLAGVPPERLVEAHGTFSSARCINCKTPHDPEWVKDHIMRGVTPLCTHPAPRSFFTVNDSSSSSSSSSPTSATQPCHGYVKPDIVFFGEGLPQRFFDLAERDFEKCDLLIVMGTSLVVQPFAGLIELVRPEVPRVLVNLEMVGTGPKIELKLVDLPTFAAALREESDRDSEAEEMLGYESSSSGSGSEDGDHDHDDDEHSAHGHRHHRNSTSSSSGEEDEEEETKRKDHRRGAANPSSSSSSSSASPSSPSNPSSTAPALPPPDLSVDDLPMKVVVYRTRDGFELMAPRECAQDIEVLDAVDNLKAMVQHAGHGSFRFEDEDNERDVFHRSTCDAGAAAFAEHLGMTEELLGIHRRLQH